MAVNHNLLPSSDETIVTETENKNVRSPLEEAHERFGIDLDTPEVVQRTIEKNGFTALELEEPHTLPTVEEWVAERVAQGYSGYNYGSFVINEAEQVGFAKVHYGSKNIQTLIGSDGEAVEFEVGGPEREQAVLEALASSGYKVPEVLGYSPESESPEGKIYEMLVIEAILPADGSVRPRDAWTPQLARVAAQKIATFAKPIADVPLFKDESIQLPVEGLLEMLPRTEGAYEEALVRVLTGYAHLDAPIVVHGDTWYNNIIARHDDSDLLFVDWELAGPGYRGQDAGRKLWDLTIAKDWSLAEYTEAADAFTDEWCKTDDDRSSLEFGVVYESLRWISERVRDINKEETTQEDREKLEQQIRQIKNHALMILDSITRKQ